MDGFAIDFASGFIEYREVGVELVDFTRGKIVDPEPIDFDGPVMSQSIGANVSRPMHCIALVGNPNCGKTALFNLLTGARQHVANYAGVTVERKIGLAHLHLRD